MRLFSGWVLASWFGLLALDGALRYAANAYGVPWAVYAKDGLLLVLLGSYATYVAATLRTYATALVLICAISYGILCGLLSGIPLAAVLFGAKMFLPFLAGYVLLRRDHLPPSAILLMYRIVVPLVVGGVVLDVLYDLPWTGTTYEFAGVSIEGSRRWGTFGLDRPAGFGRSSFESAVCLYSLLILRLVLLRGTSAQPQSSRARSYDVLLGLAAVVAIVVTTSKTSLLALAFLALVASLRHGMQTPKSVVRLSARTVAALLFGGAFAYSLAPFLFALGPANMLDDAISGRGVLARFLLQSFVERAQHVWPQALASLSGSFALWIGRGLGSVGSPQLYFNPEVYNPGDNLHVYLLLAFGAVILVFLLAYLFFLTLRLFRENVPDLALVMFLSTLFLYGATLNVIEAPALMMCLGLLLASHERNYHHVH